MADWVYDELILATKLVFDNSWNGVRAHQKQAQDLSTLLIAAPFHPVADREPAFRSANSVQRKTFDIATQHPDYAGTPTRGNRLDKVVLDEFRADPATMSARAEEIRRLIVAGGITAVTGDIDWSEFSAREGRLTVVQHLRRERDPKLRTLKLAQTKAAGLAVACEVCEFDFHRVYGTRGLDYIQVHHVLPLHASGPVKTSLSDLSLLCANCHCMIHRSSPWLTPRDLRSAIHTEH